jgi:hypothetical protein
MAVTSRKTASIPGNRVEAFGREQRTMDDYRLILKVGWGWDTG